MNQEYLSIPCFEEEERSESDLNEPAIPVQALQNRLALPRRACGQRHQVVVVYIHPLLYHFDQEMQFLIRCNSQIVQSRNYLGRLAAVSEH